MNITDIIHVVEKKAEEIAAEEIKIYNKDFPEVNLTEEIKELVKVRSTSQLTLQLSKFRFHGEEEPEEQFNKWFEANESEDLRKACRHCIEAEVKKMRENSSGQLSALDSYLKKHLGDCHQIE